MAVDWKDQARQLGAAAETGAQGRALLGEALTRLHDDGYEQLGDISTLADQREAVQEDLDAARSYAERVYGDLPTGDEPLDSRAQQRVGVALWSIAGALQREHQTATDDIGYISGFVDGLRKIGNTAGVVLPKLADALPWWVLPAVALVVFIYVKKAVLP
jgi:hypothetical protein